MTIYNYERFCPDCDDTIEFGLGKIKDIAKCPNCGSYFQANFDYSFDDGHWRDCTTLTRMGYVEGREASE